MPGLDPGISGRVAQLQRSHIRNEIPGSAHTRRQRMTHAHFAAFSASSALAFALA
ncbi:hypothetical protein SAMN04515666_101708 [Bosea lupini]|uniref:Uncharacterized protein n=1 Tax=Bosea lupini TaxID=1036779 RepID=A0A1H7HMR3_9HYPH|nr:hypothetical protein SAMN04515666_101708 [Bosea lupini]